MAFASLRRCFLNRSNFYDLILQSQSKSIRLFSNGHGQQEFGKQFKQSNVAFITIGLSAGLLAGSFLSWAQFQKMKPPILNSATAKENITLSELPKVQIARKITSETDNTNLQLVLFQYPTCPFCCKVRAFLDYFGFSYEVVEVDPVLRKEMSWSQYKKVPILLAKVENGYQQLNDSSMIVSVLRSFIYDRSHPLSDVVNYYPTMEYHDESGNLKTEIMNRYFLMYRENVEGRITNEALVEERKWRKWADDSLVHTLSPNVYRTTNEALQAFNWFSEVGEWDRLFPSWERNLIVYMGAFAMWIIGKRLKKRHNLKDDVRESLYDQCNQWMRALKAKNSPFMGGSTPNLADLAVYGVLSSIEGCIAFEDMKKRTSIASWYYPMKEAVTSHRGSQEI